MKNQTFGIEIETTGLRCERIAKALSQHFGTTARYSGRHLGDWHVPIHCQSFQISIFLFQDIPVYHLGKICVTNQA